MRRRSQRDEAPDPDEAPATGRVVAISPAGDEQLFNALRGTYRRAGGVHRVGVNSLDKMPEPDRILPDAAALLGRIPYGLHAFLPAPTTYICLLHDPIEYALGVLQRRLRGREAESDEGRRRRLEVFVRRGLARFVANNGYTRLLSGRALAAFGDDPQAILEAAKSNLRDGVACVGTTEHFEDFLGSCATTLGWTRTPRPGPPEEPVDRAAFPDSVIEELRERNALDLELHRYALELTGKATEPAVATGATRPERPPAGRIRRRGAEPTPGDLLNFIHIPKAAGGTVIGALVSEYGSRQVERRFDPDLDTFDSHPMDPEVRVLVGHMPFGVHQVLDRDVTYITLLREPVDRVVSGYYFAREPKSDQPGRVEMDSRVTLEDYVARSVSPFTTNNGQVRLLAGVSRAHFGIDPRATLDRAQHNLEHDISVVGTLDRFDEFLVLCKLLLGWTSYPTYERFKTSRVRPPVGEVSAAVRALIEERNALDIELYASARRRFEELKASIPATDFERELEAFRSEQEAADARRERSTRGPRVRRTVQALPDGRIVQQESTVDSAEDLS